MKNDKKIVNFLNVQSIRYIINNYVQRSYEWKSNNAIKLINDIINFDSTKFIAKLYNIGDFIIYQDETNVDDSGSSNVYIYDGQQRLTTIILLETVLYHYFKGKDERRSQTAEHFIVSDIFNTKLDRYEKKPKIRLRDSDNIVLQKLIDNPFELTKEDKASCIFKVYQALENEYTSSIDRAITVFDSVIRKCGYFERECESEIEAMTQFCNLNGLGVKVSTSKCALTTAYKNFECNMQYLDSESIDNSTKIYYMLNTLSNKDLEVFLMLFYYYMEERVNGIDRKKILKNMEILCEDSSIDVSKELYNFYMKYYTNMKYNNELAASISISTNAMKFLYIDIFTDKYPFIDSLSYNEKAKLFRLIETVFYVVQIKKKGNHPEDNMVNIFTNYNGDDTLINYIKNTLIDRDCYANSEELLEYLNIISLNTLKQTSNAVLTMMDIRAEMAYRELVLTHPEYKNILLDNSHISLEHIYPKSKSMDDYTFTFGNTCLVSTDMNSHLGTKDFSIKKSVYQNECSLSYITRSYIPNNYSTWGKDEAEQFRKYKIELLINFYNI